MNQLEKYTNEALGVSLTVATAADGSLWFVAKEIADALEYADPGKAYVRCKNVNSAISAELNKISNLPPATKWCSESDVNRMIMGSHKPGAEKFQDWVCDDILPAIRRTGQYRAEQVKLPVTPLVEAQVAFNAYEYILNKLGVTGNAAIISANSATAKRTGVNFLQDLGQTHLLNPAQERNLTPTELGKELRLSAQKVNALLETKGFQTKLSGFWVPTDQGKPYAALLDTGRTHSEGVPITQLKWKQTVINELQG